MSKIKTFEDACKAEGIDPTLLPIVSGLPEAYQKKSVADYKLDVVYQALNNEGQDKPWVADWTDGSWKYIPYFEFSASSGWSFNVYGGWFTHTSCGSRRACRTREIANHLGAHFMDLFKEIL